MNSESGRREVRNVSYHPKFLRNLRNLPERIIARAEKRERLFRTHPFHPSLETHKLHGKKREAWAFSVDYDYRIAFVFLTDDTVLFIDIGTHDIYR